MDDARTVPPPGLSREATWWRKVRSHVRETADGPARSDSGIGRSVQEGSASAQDQLSVGVYQDADGKTPILGVVKEAEQRLLAEETNKSYLSIDGLPEYGTSRARAAVRCRSRDHRPAARRDGADARRHRALRVAADFFRQKLQGRRIWVSRPTWVNHTSIFEAAGLQVDTYPYLDAAGTGLDFDALLAALQAHSRGRCRVPPRFVPQSDRHRPHGRTVATDRPGAAAASDSAAGRFRLPGIRRRHGRRPSRACCSWPAICPEMLVCSSFSKNFGLYGERVGALTLVAPTEEAAQIGLSHIKICIRTNYSNPPKHGGAIVATILSDPDLHARWLVDVQAMRDRIAGMRQLFVDTLRAKGVTRDFSFITRQRGMFSFSGITPEQVDKLRSDYGIYIVRSGRINVAGMTAANMDRLCDAIKAVL